MGDGRRTQACLVGEDAPGDAVLHGLKNGVAEDAAAHGLEAEGSGEDVSEDARHGPSVEDDDAQADDDVKERHKGHQVAGDAADALHPAQDHHAHQHHQDDAGDEGRVKAGAGEVVHRHGDLRGLGGVADSEGGKAPQQREERR